MFPFVELILVPIYGPTKVAYEYNVKQLLFSAVLNSNDTTVICLDVLIPNAILSHAFFFLLLYIHSAINPTTKPKIIGFNEPPIVNPPFEISSKLNQLSDSILYK